MKYAVIKDFRFKPTGDRYRPGDTFETDPERGARLQRAGFLGAAEAEPETPPAPVQAEPVHLGGGWYQYPDGTKGRKPKPGGDNE